MKYVSPEYRNEKVNVNDVITNSFMITPGVVEGTGGDTGIPEQKKVTVTGYLSHLLGGM